MREGNPMFWPRHFPVIASLPKAGVAISHLKERYIWVQVRILRETEKAILVDNGMKTWIPKSQIHRIRLRNNIFEIHVKESAVG